MTATKLPGRFLVYGHMGYGEQLLTRCYSRKGAENACKRFREQGCGRPGSIWGLRIEEV